MSLSTGSRFGGYEILDRLGAGGMGEVYRARDRSLDREVALKVLPEEFASSRERLRRFEQESRAASALSHPNIVTIHAVGSEGATSFIAMELVAGKTLRSLLAGGALPMKKLLDLAGQVADGLAAAHEKGIVHRDLKPENVMVTPDGVVKILDFGLARTSPVTGGPSDDTRPSPVAITEPGMIVGTAGYMSPEQVRGAPVDFRSDQFSFGSVLYEMATGRVAFRRDSVAETMTAILKEDPEPVGALNPKAPILLRWLIERCHAKEPVDRYASTVDLARDIRALRERLSQAGSGAGFLGVDAPGRSGRVRRLRRWLPWGSAAALALVAAVASVFAITYARRSREAARPRRLNVSPPEGTTVRSAAVSPDGRLLAIVAGVRGEKNSLYLRSLESGDMTALVGTEDARRAFWSPDGRQLAFFTPGKLKRVFVTGGAVTEICDTSGDVGAGSWSKDGVVLLVDSSRLYTVPATHGTPASLASFHGGSSIGGNIDHAVFFGDRGRFLFRQAPAERRDRTGICFGSLDGGEGPLLVAGSVYIAGVLGNQAVYSDTSGVVFAQEFDPAAERAVGEPIRLLDKAGGCTVSPDVLVCRASTGTGWTYRIELTFLDREGREVRRVGAGLQYRYPALSPDGRHAVASLFDKVTGFGDLWLLDLERDVASRFTFRPEAYHFPVWSPDGTAIVYSGKAGSGVYRLFRKPVATGSSEELLYEGPRTAFASDWSRDGKHIAFDDVDTAASKRSIWLLPLSGGGKPIPYLKSEFNNYVGQFSPDGRWMAYVSEESGRPEAYVQSIPAGGGKWQVSAAGAITVRWRADGRELFYLSASRQIVSVEVTPGPALRFGAPKPLFPSLVAQTAPGEFFPTPDGRGFFSAQTIVPTGRDAPPNHLVVVLNWRELLGKK